MRVAFLSDIHANHPALCAALALARRLGAERVVVAGDIVGSGPHPVEVVRLLSQRAIAAVSGNVERKLLSLDHGRHALEGMLERKKLGHLAWTALRLAAAERAWLAALPPELDLELGGAAVLVVHGAPGDDSDYIFPSITAAGLRARLGERRADTLVCGHSHIPFTRRVAGVRVINCGSVGRPVDGDPRGSFAIADFSSTGAARCSIARFSYPVEDVMRDVAARGVPGAVAEEYRQGIKRKGV